MEQALFDCSGHRKYLTFEETLRFVSMARRLPGRARLLCLLLAFGGCRISEALEVMPSHIEPGIVTLRTLKRRKIIHRRVPLPIELTASLMSVGGARNARLFPWHRSTAYRLVVGVMQRARIEGPQACPKGLRHGFGMRLAAAKVPPNLVQRWLGHASLTTTSIYLDAMGEEERAFAALAWRALGGKD